MNELQTGAALGGGAINTFLLATAGALAAIEMLTSNKKQLRFRTLLHEQGVVVGAGNRWVISGELSDDDIADTLKRTDRAMAQLN